MTLPYYSNLAWDDLITLQVQVDKENLIEFPLNSIHYLYMNSNPNPVLKSHASLWVTFILCIHR